MIILLALSVLLITYILSQIQKPHNYPPGPAFIPVIGHFYKIKSLSKALGGQHHAFSHLANIFNTNIVGLKFGNDLTVIVLSYPIIKRVLTEEVFEGRPDNFFMRLRSMGTRKGITGTDGELWNTQRNFVVKHLRNLGLGKQVMSTHIKNEVGNLLKILPNSGTQIRKLLAPSIINIFWDITSGSRIKGNDPRIEKLIELLNARSKAFDMSGGILNIFPWLRFVAPKRCGYDLIWRMNRELNALFMEIIEEHYKSYAADKNDDLIYIYIEQIRNDQPTFSNDQLAMVLLDLFIAGSQTTSTSLDFAFMMMILRPDIQQKVQSSLDNAFDRNEPIEYCERHRVPYVEAVLLEVLRFFLITPIIGPRRALHETELGGYRIPKNTTILISIASIHKDTSYWKDPEIFKPERFMSEDGKLVPHDNLIPFGLGRRRCLGEVLARNCLFTFFSEVIRNYTITLQPGAEEPSMIPQPGIVLSPKPYLSVFIKRY
ncbi:hypothetical protein HHI36_020264 [Cryptolaemus montrouzieri]|uniref:Cytochrome P450 n=1 Tax=Cryptolaemus montrouzieri TaxID=559131 RepID=A0ABD2NAE0_9CUCU